MWVSDFSKQHKNVGDFIGKVYKLHDIYAVDYKTDNYKISLSVVCRV